MVKLSPLTEQHLASLFALSDISEARELLTRECAENLPLVGDPTPEGLERLRFAALRLSDGKLTGLREAITLAKTDWRDLLVAAHFGEDVHAHRTWQPRRLGPSVIRQWLAGEHPWGVTFGLNAAVQVHGRPPYGALGAVISLVGLEPEPRYLVELGSGADIEVRQSHLRASESTPPDDGTHPR